MHGGSRELSLSPLAQEPREERWERVPVLSARQEQLQAPTGSRGPRGRWELQPRRGAAPWEPGLAGRIRARTQRWEQPASTSWDTGSGDGIQDWSHLPLENATLWVYACPTAWF